MSVKPQFPIESARQLRFTRPPSMLVRNLIPQSSLTLVSGPTYSGKTFFALELARSIAYGTPFLGHFPIDHPGNTLLIEQDSPKYDTGRAFWAILNRTYTYDEEQEHDFDPLDSILITWHPGLNLGNSADIAAICSYSNNLVIQTGYDGAESLSRDGLQLIIMDTFRAMHTAEENSSTEMEAIMQRIKLIRNETKAAVLLIHHAAKDPLDFNAVRGSSSIAAAADNIFHITSNKKTQLSTVRIKKARAIRPADFHFQIQTWQEPGRGEVKAVTYMGEISQVEADPESDKPYATLLRYVCSSPGRSHSDLVQWAALNSINPRTLDRYLLKLLNAKQIRKTKENGSTNYFPLDTPAPHD